MLTGCEPYVLYERLFDFLAQNMNLALSKHETVNSSLVLACERRRISGCRLNASAFAGYT